MRWGTEHRSREKQEGQGSFSAVKNRAQWEDGGCIHLQAQETSVRCGLCVAPGERALRSQQDDDGVEAGGVKRLAGMAPR